MPAEDEAGLIDRIAQVDRSIRDAIQQASTPAIEVL